MSALLLQVIQLTRLFTAAGDRRAKPAGQALARSLVLAEGKDQPATVAEIVMPAREPPVGVAHELHHRRHRTRSSTRASGTSTSGSRVASRIATPVVVCL